MIEAIPPRSALVYAATDGKHRPASHPVLSGATEPYVPPSQSAPSRVAPPVTHVAPPTLEDIKAAEQRARHRAYKRARYHSDPAYRARHLARVRRYEQAQRAERREA